MLGCVGFAHIGQKSRVGRAAVRVVLAGFCEAELAVHGKTDFKRVGVVLTVVLPPADWAEPHGSGNFQRPITTTGAEKSNRNSHLVKMDGHSDVQVYAGKQRRPLRSASSEVKDQAGGESNVRTAGGRDGWRIDAIDEETPTEEGCDGNVESRAKSVGEGVC